MRAWFSQARGSIFVWLLLFRIAALSRVGLFFDLGCFLVCERATSVRWSSLNGPGILDRFLVDMDTIFFKLKNTCGNFRYDMTVVGYEDVVPSYPRTASHRLSIDSKSRWFVAHPRHNIGAVCHEPGKDESCSLPRRVGQSFYPRHRLKRGHAKMPRTSSLYRQAGQPYILQNAFFGEVRRSLWSCGNHGLTCGPNYKHRYLLLIYPLGF